MKSLISLDVRIGEDLADRFGSPFLSGDTLVRIVENVEQIARERMHAACKRLRIPLADLLDDVDRDLTAYFSLLAPENRATRGDKNACQLFEACTEALARRMLHDVPCDDEIRNAQALVRRTKALARIASKFAGLEDDLKDRARAHSKAQADRRKGKPAADPYDKARNERIRRRHKSLLKDGRNDATAAVAREFGLSTRQVSRIVKKP